jgi:protoheme IX farnesyltransferase
VNQSAADTALGMARPLHRAADYFTLTKPRIVAMVLVTSLAGFYLASGSGLDSLLAVKLLLGTALSAAGTLALNQYMEWQSDALMPRTRSRPLPDGRLRPVEALVFGLGLLVTGWTLLAATVNWPAAAITVAVGMIYLLVYTPLKYYSPFCTAVGAVSGALPPVAGWAAASSLANPAPWLLFGIMFFWQFPHTFAIARLYREDFARAAVRFLPVVDEQGRLTGRRVTETCVALLVVSLMPLVVGTAGWVYGLVAAVAGAAMLAYGVAMVRHPGERDAARHLLFASLIYLPLVLLVLVLDRV